MKRQSRAVLPAGCSVWKARPLEGAQRRGGAALEQDQESAVCTHGPAMAPHLQAAMETRPAASTHVQKGTISVLSHVMPGSLPQHRCCERDLLSLTSADPPLHQVLRRGERFYS